MRINEREARRMIGQKYKFVNRMVGEKGKTTIVGVVEEFDFQSGFFIVDSESGMEVIHLDEILSMKKTV